MWECPLLIHEAFSFSHRLFLDLAQCSAFALSVPVFQARDTPGTCADRSSQVSRSDNANWLLCTTYQLAHSSPTSHAQSVRDRARTTPPPAHGFTGYSPMGDEPPISDCNLFPGIHTWRGIGRGSSAELCGQLKAGRLLPWSSLRP